MVYACCMYLCFKKVVFSVGKLIQGLPDSEITTDLDIDTIDDCDVSESVRLKP